MKWMIFFILTALSWAPAYGGQPSVSVFSAHPAHNNVSRGDRLDRAVLVHLPRSSAANVLFVDRRGTPALMPIPWNPAFGESACEVLNATSNQDPSPNLGDDPKVLNFKNCAELINRGNLTPLGQQLPDASAARAFNATQVVLGYYASMFGLNGLDGRGTPISAVVHAGRNYDNAFFDPEVNLMIFGDGDPEANTGDYTAALDVAGHEMTHGVIFNIADHGHGMPEVDENGALNEGISDIMGVLINRRNFRTKSQNPDIDARTRQPSDFTWSLGHGIFKETLTADQKHANETALRSLKDPRSMKTTNGRNQVKAFPSKYSGKILSGHGDRDHFACTDNNDLCQEHANATIPGHAAFLFATRLVPVIQTLPSLRGRLHPSPASLESAEQKAEDIVARVTFFTMAEQLTGDDNFPSWAVKMVQTCEGFDPARLVTSGQSFVRLAINERELICRVLVSSLHEVELLGPRGERVNLRR